jgi:hypothetical protein
VVTIDQIPPRQRHEEVQKVMPANEPGVMVTDRGHGDNAEAFAAVRQPTCPAHIQWAISDVLATKPAGRTTSVRG